ncbi:Glycoside hydrolase, superfamily [Pseudocohnilembus persalinus]|uniref:Glycoside hydrolase, superfamily n=1 Tax=Pseudocohnilembus persalinus TaxID=266149 RepID=A0A0V0QG78_PSEPJ|nr:Glycoside hydrolase, superfamily [Pseudocohnilembus persalinus]|eukprot:KRX01186.1 Glycoside hydrolase, superfamily [Pseudocohnilembus persalinus]
MIKILFLIQAFLLISTLAVTGVDISQGVGSSTCSCLANQGYQFVIARGYKSYGALDTNAYGSLSSCKAQGLITDAYHFPCVNKVSATQQANDSYNALHSVVGTFWIDVESNPSSGCGWTSNINTNCQFLKDLVNAYKAKGALVGIYGSYYQWESIFGAAGNCPYFSNLPLWYAHYDNSQTFSDFRSFGGWTKPAMKQYVGDTTVCSTGVDLNWYPNSQSEAKSFLPISE